MSEEETKTEENKGKSPLGIILVLFAILAIILGYGLYNNAQKAKDGADTQTAAVSEKSSKGEEASQTVAGTSTQTTDVDASIAVELDIDALSKPRILGDENAPVKISEHSSFTCGHCGNFHATNFKKIKEDYIATGKAYITFDDFPRNRPDLLIGSIARCVPDEAYFNFIQLVFETQEKWINDTNFIDYIKQNAKLAGANMAKVEACYESKELQQKMVDSREAAFKNHNVDSTPTLVINDTVKIGGMDSYAAIKEALDAAYEASQKAE